MGCWLDGWFEWFASWLLSWFEIFVIRRSVNTAALLVRATFNTTYQDNPAPLHILWGKRSKDQWCVN